jgi:transcriptional regulator with PAS, ATPase and Fis domain
MQQDKHAAISSIAKGHAQPFDRIVILANTWEESWSSYESWLKKKMATMGRPWDDINIHKAHIDSPIDYETIAKEAQKWISKLSRESDSLYINLSSGTPAMAAMSIIVGKAKLNTYFYQSRPDGTIQLDSIPFDFKSELNASAARTIATKATDVPDKHVAFEKIVAISPAMKEQVRIAQKLAPIELPVLVFGETGTGKEVISTAIHKASSRASKNLVTINCGALPENLVDSILFGHVKGAFTGAIKDQKGLFEQADGGTLFLDEVGELTLEAQVKLLRALQQGEIKRVGDDKAITVDVRIIAATHRNLLEMVEEGYFREDLFYRLALGIIEIPALRQRLEDIEPLVLDLAKEINSVAASYSDYKSKKLSQKAIKFILEQAWFGNVRELWNTLNRAFLLSDNLEISDKDIENAMIKRSGTRKTEEVVLMHGQQVDIKQLTENYQKKYIAAALKSSGYVKKTAANMLGLGNHQNLSNWMDRLGMEMPKNAE